MLGSELLALFFFHKHHHAIAATPLGLIKRKICRPDNCCCVSCMLEEHGYPERKRNGGWAIVAEIELIAQERDGA